MAFCVGQVLPELSGQVKLGGGRVLATLTQQPEIFFFARPLESVKGLLYITKRLLWKMKTQRNQ